MGIINLLQRIPFAPLVAIGLGAFAIAGMLVVSAPVLPARDDQALQDEGNNSILPISRYKTTTDIKQQEILTEGCPLLDNSGWATYTNTKYGFTISYPHDYDVRNWSKEPLSRSDSLLFRKDRNADISPQLVSHGDQYNLPLLGILNTSYVNYIRNPAQHAGEVRVQLNSLNRFEVYFFIEENPGAFGDWRNTIVALMPFYDIFVIIKKSPAVEFDLEFTRIVCSFQIEAPLLSEKGGWDGSQFA